MGWDDADAAAAAAMVRAFIRVCVCVCRYTVRPMESVFFRVRIFFFCGVSCILVFWRERERKSFEAGVIDFRKGLLVCYRKGWKVFHVLRGKLTSVGKGNSFQFCLRDA